MPQLGWSSWNHFGPNIDENLTFGIADAMVSSGMARAANDAGGAYQNAYMTRTGTVIAGKRDNGSGGAGARGVNAGEEIFLQYGPRYWRTWTRGRVEMRRVRK